MDEALLVEASGEEEQAALAGKLIRASARVDADAEAAWAASPQASRSRRRR
jgi:hypothetical protein